MQEVFYEESALLQKAKPAAIKYNILKIISIFSYVVFGIWLFFVIMFYEFGEGNILLNILLALIPAALFFASGFIMGRFKNRFYVEYDYTFVTGSIRFSKVIKNSKRKFIIKFECSDVEKIGKIGSGTFEKYYSMPNIKRQILTSNAESAEGKDFYYIVANVDEEKHLFILECTEMFLVNILKMANKRILEEDYKK